MDIYCIGLNLLEAQNIIEHGEFLPWLRREFGMGKTSAYEFIHVAKVFESKFPIIGNLINSISPTALYKLVAPSTCRAAGDEAIGIIKAGKVVELEVAKNLIKQYKISKIRTKQQSDANKIKALALPKTEIGQIGQSTSNSMPASFTPQRDEVQNLITESNSYKAQLEAIQIVKEKLELEVANLLSELTLLKLARTRNRKGLNNKMFSCFNTLVFIVLDFCSTYFFRMYSSVSTGVEPL